MNSETIRKIIKEELQALLLTEKFQSKKLTNLYSLLSAERWSGGKKIFDKIARAKSFDWANTPDSAVKKATSGNADANTLNIFVVTKAKQNTRDRSYGYNTVRPGLLGMTLGKKVLGGNGNIVSKRGDRAGEDYTKKGIHNFKAFNEFSDEVYQINIVGIPSSADVQKSRAEAKDGAAALMTARDVLRKNKQRYQDALTMKAGEGGWKSARDMVKRATDIFTNAIGNHTKMLSNGMYMNTWNNEYGNASNLYSSIMDKFKRFQEQNKSAMKYKADGREMKYHTDRMAGTLKDMQDLFKDFAKRMKQLENAKPEKIKAGW